MNPEWVGFAVGFVIGAVAGAIAGFGLGALLIASDHTDNAEPQDEEKPRPTVEVGRGHEHGGARGAPRLGR